MKRSLLFLAFISFAVAPLAFGQSSSSDETHIQKEVRHELLSLPRFDVFDNIKFRVAGNAVELSGQVTEPIIKSDAENAVKHIQGVQQVTNNIEVLPPSPNDNQLRRALYRAIYGDPTLDKYAMSVQKPIRIIVKGGRVTLEGVVDNETDKNVANIRAKGVPGIFSVTNNLQVVPS